MLYEMTNIIINEEFDTTLTATLHHEYIDIQMYIAYN